MAEKGRVAVVPPRFGADLVGGSEAVSREVALGLSARGWEVDVLTTCAVDHYTWANDLPAGVTTEDGLTVHRFPTVPSWSRAGHKAELAIQAGRLPALDDQVSWLSYRFRAPALFSHVVRHAPTYDAMVFSPYLFWTTAVCAPAVADRAVVIPCLHDEQYARLEVLQPAMADAAAVWFLSEPEHQLAHRLGPVAERHQVTGAGVDVPGRYDPEGFMARHGVGRPFVLYAGRRELGKGWEWLLRAYRAALEHDDPGLDLVTMGVGRVAVPPGLDGRVIDLGFVEPGEKQDAFAAATVYVQPSLLESFSRTIMEAWLAGTPVVAPAASEVVAWHCARSHGGLLFDDEAGFSAILSSLARSPEQASELGANGRRYVLEHYRWDGVLDLMEHDLRRLQSS